MTIPFYSAGAQTKALYSELINGTTWDETVVALADAVIQEMQELVTVPALASLMTGFLQADKMPKVRAHLRAHLDDLPKNLSLATSNVQEMLGLGQMDVNSPSIMNIFGSIMGQAAPILEDMLLAMEQGQPETLTQSVNTLVAMVNAEKVALAATVKQLSALADTLNIPSLYMNPLAKQIIDALAGIPTKLALLMVNDGGGEDDQGPSEPGGTVVLPPTPETPPSPIIQPSPDLN